MGQETEKECYSNAGLGWCEIEVLAASPVEYHKKVCAGWSGGTPCFGLAHALLLENMSRLWMGFEYVTLHTVAFSRD